MNKNNNVIVSQEEYVCLYLTSLLIDEAEEESNSLENSRPNRNPCPMPIDLCLVPSSNGHGGRYDHLIKGQSYI